MANPKKCIFASFTDIRKLLSESEPLPFQWACYKAPATGQSFLELGSNIWNWPRWDQLCAGWQEWSCPAQKNQTVPCRQAGAAKVSGELLCPLLPPKLWKNNSIYLLCVSLGTFLYHLQLAVMNGSKVKSTNCYKPYNVNLWILQYIPVKCKLTVSTPSLILSIFKNQVLRLKFQVSIFHFRASRYTTIFLRILSKDFEETIYFLNAQH